MVNDLASPERCGKIEASAYSVLSLNFTGEPLALRLGVCLPLKCSQKLLGAAFGAIQLKVAALIEEELPKCNGCLPANARVGLYARNIQEYHAEWQRNTFLLFVALSAFFLLFLAF